MVKPLDGSVAWRRADPRRNHRGEAPSNPPAPVTIFTPEQIKEMSNEPTKVIRRTNADDLPVIRMSTDDLKEIARGSAQRTIQHLARKGVLEGPQLRDLTEAMRLLQLIETKLTDNQAPGSFTDDELAAIAKDK